MLRCVGISLFVGVVGVVSVGCRLDPAARSGSELEENAVSAQQLGSECVSLDEERPTVGGYSADQVTIESQHAACGAGVCLINRFQGRSNCPYGANADHVSAFVELYEQAPADALAYATTVDAETGALPQLCTVAGSDGSEVDDYVREEVPPQFASRPPEDAIYCTCRCANHEGETDDGEEYCGCGEGFTCEQLVDYLGLGDEELSGAYCVRAGTAVDSDGPADFGAKCDASIGNCD